MRGSLMRLFTKAKHIEVLKQHPSDTGAARVYSELGGKEIGRQTVAYWRKIFIEQSGNLTAADRIMKEQRVYIKPQPDDDISQSLHIPEMAHRIMVIPDQHMPYQHPDMIPFLVMVRDAFNPDLTVNLGDELDYHALSFHDADPNLDSAGTELEKAKVIIQKLHKEFPESLVCHSNHGSMVYRKAKAHGVPVQMLKRYRDVLFPEHGAPGWSWSHGWRVRTPLGTVMFKHQASGALSDAAHNQCNLVVGHNHGLFEIQYSASSAHLYWAMTSGCLIDKDAMAFAYGKHSLRKPMIGCSVIIEGRPILIPMVLDEDGRWNGSIG